MNGNEFVISLLPSVYKEHDITSIADYSKCVCMEGVNPNTLTGFDTQTCLYFLLRKDSPHLDELKELNGLMFNLDDYWSFVESQYKPLKRVSESNFKPHTYLASMIKKQRMFFNYNKHLLWNYTLEKADNDFCVTFEKVYWFEDTEYTVAITFSHIDGEEQVSKTYASKEEIESSKGACMRINYPDRKFKKELNGMSLPSTEIENITNLGTFYVNSLTNKVEKVERKLIALV